MNYLSFKERLIDFIAFNLTDIRKIDAEFDLRRLSEWHNVLKRAFRCYIKLPHVLFENAMSDFVQETILIQVDTEPHDFIYKPDKVFLNKFDVFTQIAVTPPDVLLAQKFYALLNRKRAKGL